MSNHILVTLTCLLDPPYYIAKHNYILYAGAQLESVGAKINARVDAAKVSRFKWETNKFG